MKIYAKALLGTKPDPVEEVVYLRCTGSFSENTLTVTPDFGVTSWGVCFEPKPGYTVLWNKNINLSVGSKDGHTFLVSTGNRPTTLDYFLEIQKNGVTVKTFRIISQI